jgi:hypothetical protein
LAIDFVEGFPDAADQAAQTQADDEDADSDQQCGNTASNREHERPVER